MTVVCASTKPSVPRPRVRSVRDGVERAACVGMEASWESIETNRLLRYRASRTITRSHACGIVGRMPAPRSPRRDAMRTRSRLVEAAARAFRDRGLGASVNAIAQDAGVNVATLYRHF